MFRGDRKRCYLYDELPTDLGDDNDSAVCELVGPCEEDGSGSEADDAIAVPETKELSAAPTTGHPSVAPVSAYPTKSPASNHPTLAPDQQQICPRTPPLLWRLLRARSLVFLLLHLPHQPRRLLLLLQFLPIAQ